MVFSQICLSLVIIALFSSVVHGIFEEQAGEYDWKIDNIGVIQQSFDKVKIRLLHQRMIARKCVVLDSKYFLRSTN
jgi:hypothetical protein